VPDTAAVHLARCGATRNRTLPNGRQVVSGGGGSGDYTANPRASIDTDRLPRWQGRLRCLVTFADLERCAAKAREQEHERRRRNGQALDAQAVELRLEQARLVARERGMDVSGELWVIRQIVATGREQSAARRLAKLETQLQQRAA
jgi:hypothetical protein